MKKLFFLLLSFFATKANCQNEFAATAFYSDFKKIYADAQSGFVNYKGDKRKNEFEELATEYKVKLLLPLADSGKIVFPVSANLPYVIYYFEPGKLRLKVDQRAMNLRDVLINIFDQPLYSRTETSVIKDHPYTDSWYFTDPAETRAAMAAFRMTIYFKDGKYNLAFEIRGKQE